MSLIETNIVLSPPEHFCIGNTVETFSGTAVCCPYCKGQKFLVTENHRDKEKKEQCPICKGSGHIFPEVSVTWKAFPCNSRI